MLIHQRTHNPEVAVRRNQGIKSLVLLIHSISPSCCIPNVKFARYLIPPCLCRQASTLGLIHELVAIAQHAVGSNDISAIIFMTGALAFGLHLCFSGFCFACVLVPPIGMTDMPMSALRVVAGHSIETCSGMQRE